MFVGHMLQVARPALPKGIAPYFGTGPVSAAHDQNLILGLQFRGPTLDRLNPEFTLETWDDNTTMYYAYPMEYGLATFIDAENGMEGGWDGAMLSEGQLGPVIVPVTVNGVTKDFYLYETDWPNLGLVRWRVV